MAGERTTKVTCCGFKTLSNKTWTKLGALCNMMGCLLIFLACAVILVTSLISSSSSSPQTLTELTLRPNRTNENGTVEDNIQNNFDRMKTPIYIFIIFFAGFGCGIAVVGLYGVKTGRETVLNLWAGILVFYAVGQIIAFVLSIIVFCTSLHFSFLEFLFQLFNMAILVCNMFFVGTTLNYRLQVIDDKNSKKLDAEMVGLVSVVQNQSHEVP